MKILLQFQHFEMYIIRKFIYLLTCMWLISRDVLPPLQSNLWPSFHAECLVKQAHASSGLNVHIAITTWLIRHLYKVVVQFPLEKFYCSCNDFYTNTVIQAINYFPVSLSLCKIHSTAWNCRTVIINRVH